MCDDAEERQGVYAIAMPLPAYSEGDVGQRQEEIESGFDCGGREVAEAGLVPGSDVFGVVGIRKPFAVVGVAEEIVCGDYESERSNQAGSVLDQSGVDGSVFGQPLKAEPSEAAGGEEETFGSGEFGGGEAEGGGDEAAAAVLVEAEGDDSCDDEEGELSGFEAASGGLDGEGGAGAE